MSITDLKIAAVQFSSHGTVYHYFVQPGDNPVPGDFVITSFEDPINARYDVRPTDPKFATVISVLAPGTSSKETKPYLLLIPRAVLLNRKELRDRIVQEAGTRTTALARLRELLKAEEEIQRFEMLAKTNPEAAELLAQYRRTLTDSPLVLTGERCAAAETKPTTPQDFAPPDGCATEFVHAVTEG